MPRDTSKDPFPTKQLIIIGICRFSEPIAFNSILAYSSVMVQDLGIAEENAAFYSGLLISAYAIAEAITALSWGAVSDVYGRKPVALIGLGGVALSSLLFGFAKTYWVALLARLIGGALNGNVAIMQTMVAEVVTNPEHEPRAYATQPFVWTLGGIIGSAMGGFLAQPAVYYPSVFSQDGIFGRFPYLLPNLVAVVAIVMAIIQGILFLEETNPAFKDPQPDDEAVTEQTSLLGRQSRTRERARSSISHASFRERSGSVIHAIRENIREVRKRPSFMEEGLPMAIDQRFDLRRSSFGTMHSIHLPQDRYRDSPAAAASSRLARPPMPTLYSQAAIEPAPKQKKTFNYTVVMIILSLVFVCFHQMAFISTIPVYLLDRPKTPMGKLDLIGGLGNTLPEVGTYLAVNGFIALFIQAVVFPFFVESIGVWKSFVSMTIMYPTCYILIPFISSWPKNLVSPGVYLDFILQDIYGIIIFPCALILLKNATSNPASLGKVNGAAMSACCLARTFASPLVGAVYALGGSAAAWFTLAGVAVLGAIQLFWIPNEGNVENVEIESAVKSGLRRASFVTVSENAVDDY